MADIDSGKQDLKSQFVVGKDRLYGLRKPRDKMLGGFESGFKDSYAESDVTMDRVNNRLGLSLGLIGPGKYQFPAADDIAHPTDKAFAAFLSGREKSGSAMSTRGENARIRRATKLGMDFTVQQGGTVRFMLDKIDMKAVADKRNFKDEPWKDVTGSELRYLYRNRANKELMKGVQFYEGNAPVAAPWERRPEDWTGYQPGTRQPHSWPEAEEASSMRAISPRRVTNTAPPARPPWNPSTRIDRPLSETATRSTVRQQSASTTGKVGSKHWTG